MTAVARTTRSQHLLERDRRIRTRRRLRTADLLHVAFWTSVATAVGLYLAYGGLATITSAPSAVDAIGIVSGLIGTDLILVMLLIAARIPLIDRAVGQDVAMGFHRRLGKPALYLLLAHFVLLTLGWAAADAQDVIAETVTIFTTPDMALAYLGLGLLIVVVFSSLVAVRRRFPYEVWHAIHLLSYAAVLVAVPHQLSVGGMLAEGTWQRAYWIALYVAALGAIAWYRFASPSFAHSATASELTLLSPSRPVSPPSTSLVAGSTGWASTAANTRSGGSGALERGGTPTRSRSRRSRPRPRHASPCASSALARSA